MTSTANDDPTAEVERVAAAFEAWFAAGDPAGLDAIAAAFHPDFVTVTPDGALHRRDDVLTRLAGAGGANGPRFRITVEGVRALPSPGPGLTLLTYLERQGGTTRRSTALLRTESPRWLVVHETLIGAGETAS